MLGNETLPRSPKVPESEADAYAFLEGLRWGDAGPTECPHCGSQKGAWYLKPKNPEGRKSKGGSAARSQRRVWKCRENSCRRQFSVLTNTVLHATKMPVRAWIGTIVDLCEDPSGVSAREIAGRWNVTEKSAWAMLSRIQEALNAPESAGAQLRSNAPLWFELTPADAAKVKQNRQVQAAAELEEAERKEQAGRDVAARIERDVQRALAEVAEPGKTSEDTETASEIPVASREPHVREVLATSSEDAVLPPEKKPTNTDVSSSNGAVPGAKDQVDARGSGDAVANDPADSGGAGDVAANNQAGSGGSGAVLEVEDRGGSGGLGAASRAKARDVAAEDQVKSDVERALAEVFGEAVPGPDGAGKGVQPHQVAATADSDPAGRSDSPKKGKNRAVRSADRGADVASPAAAEPAKAPTTARKSRSKAARKKAKWAKIEARKRSQAKQDHGPQPVDNSTGSASQAGHDGGGASGAKPSLSHATSLDADRVTSGEDAGSLGGGWLDEGADDGSESSSGVSARQGQLDGIEGSDLGPSWTKPDIEVSSKGHQRDRPSEHQLDFFSAETETDG